MLLLGVVLSMDSALLSAVPVRCCPYTFPLVAWRGLSSTFFRDPRDGDEQFESGGSHQLVPAFCNMLHGVLLCAAVGPQQSVPFEKKQVRQALLTRSLYISTFGI